MKTVAGIDLGTQSLKVIFYDYEHRRVVSAKSSALDLFQKADGTAEQQADWWVRALAEALQETDSDIRKSVQAIGVSGQQHGFVPVNRDGRVLAPVKLWCDTSTEQECAEITERFGGAEACLNEVGNLVLPGYTASKIAWLKKHHPARYEELDGILLPHDYLNFFLTGERCMEAGDASGTAILDIRKRSWSKKMLRAIDPDRDLSECLPGVRLDHGFIGRLREDRAEQLGLPGDIPVSAGGGDNMMGAIGTGNVRPGAMTMSLGTSGTVYAYSDQPIIDPAGNIAAFCSSTGGWLPLMCTMNCTVTTELMRDLLNADIEEFEQQLGRADRGAGGIITLPFFNGERTPNLPRAKGCIVGLDSSNCRPENLLRSGMEGATFALRYGIDELRSLGIATEDIVLTGGGSGSAEWRQAVADICATPVTILEQDEGASLGAALQALSALEGASPTELPELVSAHLSRDESRCCTPATESARYYQDVYASYRAAVAAAESLYR